jgi:hypothetical protein
MAAIQGLNPPYSSPLYQLCRAGTDPAIDRALEEARSPWGQVAKLARQYIDWDQVTAITNSLIGAADIEKARARLDLATAEDDE